jgi:methyl acetate hydrolase
LRAPKRDINTHMLRCCAAASLRLFPYQTAAPGAGAQPTQRDYLLEASLMTPLLFDPGDKWEYSGNID